MARELLQQPYAVRWVIGPDGSVIDRAEVTKNARQPGNAFVPAQR
jgi:hypothetical protein